MRIMELATILILAYCSTIASNAATFTGDFTPGTGAELRSSTNYMIADTLGQFVVGESSAPDDSYACGRIEHGFWHSERYIPSIADIKQTPNNSWVDAYSKVVTAGSDQFYREFYVSDESRVSAIRINLGSNPQLVSEGDLVDVSGVIKGTAVARYIDYPVVTVRFQDAAQIGPLFTPNGSLGGSGTDVGAVGGAGLLNTSFLMKTSGRVTFVDIAVPSKFFYVDDGSGLSDGLVIGGKTMRGVRIWIGNLAAGNTIVPPIANQYITVTGICAPYSASGKTHVMIRPREQVDISVMGF